MNSSDLPVRPDPGRKNNLVDSSPGGKSNQVDFSPYERRQTDDADDAGNTEPHAHHPGVPGGGPALRSPEDPPAHALAGLGHERIQEGAQGGGGGRPPRRGAGPGPGGDDPKGRMTFAQHLDELRSRLLRSIVALLAAVT